MASKKKNRGKERKAKKLLKQGRSESSQDAKWLSLIRSGTTGPGIKCIQCAPTIPKSDSTLGLLLDTFMNAVKEETYTFERVAKALYRGFEALWNDPNQRGEANDLFIRLGTNAVLLLGPSQSELEGFSVIAGISTVLEMYNGSFYSTLLSVAPKMRDLNEDSRDLIKYFAKRTKCHCLDEMLQQVKERPKVGRCIEKRRSSLFLCSECSVPQYCSSRCQKLDWNAHKGNCHIHRMHNSAPSLRDFEFACELLNISL